MSKITIIDMSIKKEDIVYRDCPIEVKALINSADVITKSGFQEVIGHIKRKAIFSIGGYWNGNKFILESIGGLFHGNNHLQYSKNNGLKITIE